MNRLHDVQITSEWGTPNMIENGLVPELLLNSKYGHQLHVWDLRRRKHLQTIDLGGEQQLILELRQARDPTRTYRFVGVVISLKDLSASVWLWHRPNGQWAVKMVIEIPALTLIAFGLYRLLARHRVRVGMQVGAADLLLWSFLMATAHGAGLMLLPVLLGMPIGILHHDNVHMGVATAVGSSAVTALAAVTVHTAVMLAVAGTIAIAVYEWVGLAFLRRGWINLDLVWVLALIGAGAILLVFAVW